MAKGKLPGQAPQDNVKESKAEQKARLEKELALAEAPIFVAIKRGHDGLKVREIGEEFPFLGKPGRWMKLKEEVEAEKAKADKPAAKSKSQSKGRARQEGLDVL